MALSVVFSSISLPRSGVLAVLAADGGKLLETGEDVDKRVKGALNKAIKLQRFTGEKAQVVELLAPQGVAADRILVIGAGKADKLDALAAREIGSAIVQRLKRSGEKAAAIAVDAVPGASLTEAEFAANIGYGGRLVSYDFDRYQTRRKAEEKPSLARLTVMTGAAAQARRAYAPLDKIADGVFFTRDLVSEPANVLYPESLAREARSLTKLGVKVEVFGEARMKRLGMGALLAVGEGSTRESKLIVLEWNGAGVRARAKPIAFVGKGVTFDTGGISLKPGRGMGDMKFDMGGGGTVIGLMKALAGRKAKVHAVGIVGAVENMPSGNAQRPGDVVTSMSGQTIEVLNTDAEGRLVLADVLHYAQTRFKPRVMIDLATLTGAILNSLGRNRAGLFSNDDDLIHKLEAASKAEGEKLWAMPMDPEFDRQLRSPIADMQNIASDPLGGSIVAAKFLERFVGKEVPWAHLDIAGTVWAREDKPMAPKGASGWGVRLLNRLVADNYEGR